MHSSCSFWYCYLIWLPFQLVFGSIFHVSSENKERNFSLPFELGHFEYYLARLILVVSQPPLALSFELSLQLILVLWPRGFCQLFWKIIAANVPELSPGTKRQTGTFLLAVFNFYWDFVFVFTGLSLNNLLNFNPKSFHLGFYFYHFCPRVTIFYF